MLSPVFRRAGAALFLAIGWLVLLVALAQPASAHTVSGVGATNWASNLTSVSPQVAGLKVRLVEDGSRLEISNTGPEIVVIGYSQEPYLRVGADGVYENVESPSTYLNCTRTGCPIPSGLNVDGPPEWKKISDGHIARYHDHRTHWMGSREPPNVTKAPGKFHVEANWTVTMMQGSTAITVKGNYVWIPGTSPLPWLAVALVLAAVGTALGLLGLWGFPLAAAAVVVTANDIYHSIGIAAFWSGNLGYQLGKFFSGSYYSMVGWVLGLLGAWLLVKRRVDGLYAAVFAGGSAALFTGLLDLTVLSRSQVPFTASITVDRITVVISLGLGLGVAIGALIAIRATKPQLEDENWDDDDDGIDVDDGDGDGDDGDGDVVLSPDNPSLVGTNGGTTQSDATRATAPVPPQPSEDGPH